MSDLILPGDSLHALALREPALLVPGRKPPLSLLQLKPRYNQIRYYAEQFFRVSADGNGAVGSLGNYAALFSSSTRRTSSQWFYPYSGAFTNIVQFTVTDTVSSFSVFLYEANATDSSTYNGFGTGATNRREIHWSAAVGDALTFVLENGNANNVVFNSSIITPLNQTLTAVVRYDDTTLQIWVNGVYGGSHTPGKGTPAPRTVSYYNGVGHLSAARYLQGGLHLGVTLSAALPEAECQQLSLHPYALFEPANSSPYLFPAATGGGVTLTAAGIASAEAFGAAALSTGAVSLTPAAIASLEAFGAASFAAGATELTPAAVASAEAFGTASLSLGAVSITPAGIASAESFGTAVVTTGAVTLTPTAIASLEAFGTAVVSAGATILTPSGVASAEAFGAAALSTGAVTIVPAGIVSAESFTTSIIALAGLLLPVGIASQESVGAAVVVPGAIGLTPAAVGSAEAFGAADVSQAYFLRPDAIASAETFGAATLTTGAVVISPVPIASAEAFGAAAATSLVVLLPTSIASAEAFGTAVASTGAAVISPSSIASAEAFGSATVQRLLQDLAPLGIASLESFGAAIISNPGIGLTLIVKPDILSTTTIYELLSTTTEYSVKH